MEECSFCYDLLPLELKELQGADFDLSLLGFDPDELDRLLNGPEEDAVTAGETEPDAVPGIPETGDSMRGRIYRLGDHLLMCGDATNADDVATLMDGATADLWLTDPPYNVGYTNSLGQTIENDDLEDGQFHAFLNDSFNNAGRTAPPTTGIPTVAGPRYWNFISRRKTSGTRRPSRSRCSSISSKIPVGAARSSSTPLAAREAH